jgi:surface antigen
MEWCNAAQDTIITLPGDNTGDNRECTSFAYWYFTSVEGKPLSVSGNANQWATTAGGPGRYVDNTPQDGAIGVSTAGYYGHVMIVLATPGETYKGVTAGANQVLVMSMNRDFQGHFGYDLKVASSLYYIH